MGRRDPEARMLRGEVGVDGAPVDEAAAPEDRDQAAALESLHRNRAYLGREFLTWILWASNDGAPLCTVDGHGVTVLVTGRVILRGLAGEATELAVKGHLSAYSEVVRFAIDRGLIVHSARLRLEWNEQVYELTVDAEHLDVRGALAPKTEAESEEADPEDEVLARMATSERLGTFIDGLWSAFVAVRMTPKWSRRVVPAMKAWLAVDGEAR